MNMAEVIQELNFLGMDKRDARALLLLPLVRVGWSTEHLTSKAEHLIRAAAQTLGVTHGEGTRLLEGWLQRRPTDEFTERGYRVLRELAPHTVGLGSDITRADLAAVLEHAHAVGRALGGLFGFLRNDARIKDALRDVESHIAPDAIDYANVDEWDEDELDEDTDGDTEDDDDSDDEDDEDDDEDDDDDMPSGGLRLGVAKARVSRQALERRASKPSEPGKKRRVAPTVGASAATKGAAVAIGASTEPPPPPTQEDDSSDEPPGFD